MQGEAGSLGDARHAPSGDRDPARAGRADSAEHARLILDTAHDAFVSMDRDGVIIDWNRAAERTFGWSRVQALGRPLVDTLVPERFREAHLTGVRHYLATGEGPVLFQTIELPALRRDGSEFRAEITIWPSHAAGQLRFNAFVRDVTERTQMTARLALLQRVTAAANGADNLGDAIITALEEVAAITGWPVGHAYLRSWDDEQLVPSGWWTAAAGEYGPFCEATEHRGFELGEGLPGRVAVSGHPEWICPLSEDRNFPRSAQAAASGLVSAFAFPVLSGAHVDAVLEFYAPWVDRPDEHTLDLMANIGIQLGRVFERLRLTADLRDAVRTKSRLVSVLAHEIRTPLATIEGFAEILLEECRAEGDDAKAEQLEVVHRSTTRLQRLVTQALTASRLDAGVHPVEASSVEVIPTIKRVLAELQVEDTVDVAGADLLVRADPDHLVQIITNFVTNAVTYGQAPITIEVATNEQIEGEPRQVLIRVCDHGRGVDPAFVPQLFERFSRGAVGGSGAGLGLAIARELTQINGGSVWYEPREPHGACFVCRLPEDV